MDSKAKDLSCERIVDSWVIGSEWEGNKVTELPYYKFKVNWNFPAPFSGKLVPGKLGWAHFDRACMVRRVPVSHSCLLFYKSSVSVNTLPIKETKCNGAFGPGPVCALAS